MARVFQEFYCAKSGGGCGGFITIRLNMAINGIVEVVCPNCKHKHQRKIKDGVLTDEGRGGKVKEELIPTIAAYSKKSKHPESKKRIGTRDERKAVVIEDDPKKRPWIPVTKGDLWIERFGGS